MFLLFFSFIFLLILLYFCFDVSSDLTLLYYRYFGRKPETLKGKIIWVTGSSFGIGEQLVYELAKIGAKLILSARNLKKLVDVKRKCLELNATLTDDDILLVEFDICKVDLHESMLKKVLDHFQKIDLLINNAGKALMAETTNTTYNDEKEIFDVNLFGLTNLTKLVVKHWLSNKQCGHIVVNVSLSAICQPIYGAAYSASKSALKAYFHSLRAELLSRRISISMIYPGFIDTELINFSSENSRVDMAKVITEGRMTTEDCTKLMLVAIANRLTESWISTQPILFIMYLATLCELLHPASKALGTKLHLNYKISKKLKSKRNFLYN